MSILNIQIVVLILKPCHKAEKKSTNLHLQKCLNINTNYLSGKIHQEVCTGHLSLPFIHRLFSVSPA